MGIMEFVNLILPILKTIITTGTIGGVVIAAIARIIPNEKLYRIGYNAGFAVDKIGAGKLGSATWEKIEDFLVNSIGKILSGFKAGLDDEGLPPEEPKDDVRI